MSKSKPSYEFLIVEREIIDRGGHKLILATAKDPVVYRGSCPGGSAGRKIVDNHLAMRSDVRVNGKPVDAYAYQVIWEGRKPYGFKDFPRERLSWSSVKTEAVA